MRVGFAVFLVCATLASCTRAAPEPHPDGTLEPSITESSPMPTANPDNPACTLLTKKDRAELVGYSMDAEVPVRPAAGSAECIWVHSLHESSRAAIHVVALSGDVWSKSLRPQVRVAMLQPNNGKALSKRLKKTWKELGEAGRLPADQICPTYLMLAESRGAVKNGDSLFYTYIGSMPAAFAISCEDGNLLAAGYGEYGVGPSIALQNGVLRLLDAARDRSADVFKAVEAEAGTSDESDEAGSASPTPGSDEDTTTDEDTSPSPEPSPSETDENGSDDSDAS